MTQPTGVEEDSTPGAGSKRMPRLVYFFRRRSQLTSAQMRRTTGGEKGQGAGLSISQTSRPYSVRESNA